MRDYEDFLSLNFSSRYDLSLSEPLSCCNFVLSRPNERALAKLSMSTLDKFVQAGTGMEITFKMVPCRAHSASFWWHSDKNTQLSLLF